jgi:hypothetical protein
MVIEATQRRGAARGRKREMGSNGKKRGGKMWKCSARKKETGRSEIRGSSSKFEEEWSPE